MVTTKYDGDFQGYSDQVRVNYHVDSIVSDATTTPSKVKFSCCHKSYPSLEVVISLSISALVVPATVSGIELEDFVEDLYFRGNQSSILTIESLRLVDPQQHLAQLSDDVLENLLSSILLATFEYGNSRSIREWQIPVNAEFDQELSKVGLNHQCYSFDNNGRRIIGVLPSEFLAKGKQLVDSWTRRMFECQPPLLN